MDKRTRIAFGIALAVFMGCGREAVPQAQAPAQVISWNVAQETGTKTYPSGYSAYPIQNTFGTFALQTGDKWADATNFVTYIDNREVRYEPLSPTGRWTTSSEYIWPQGGYLHFASYSPYSIHENVTLPSKSQGIVITGFTLPTHLASQTAITSAGGDIVGYTHDLMVSGNEECDYDCAATYTNSAPTLDNGTVIGAAYGDYQVGVRTQFNHILTLLQFRFQRQNIDVHYDSQRIEVTDITLTNLNSSGNYTAGTGLWTGQGDVVASSTLLSGGSERIVTAGDPEGATTVISHYLALPQTVSAQQITVSYRIISTIAGILYSENVTQTALLSGAGISEWLAGKSVTYTITLSPVRDPIVFTATSQDWPAESEWIKIDLT